MLMLVFDDFSRRKRDEKFAVLDSFQTQNRVGKRPHLFDFAAQDDDFHTIVVADMNVQHRDDKIKIVVLQSVHFIR